MSWNYRVMRHVEPDGSEWFGIHEVYYDLDGNPVSWTERTIEPFGETPDDLTADLDRMSAAIHRPVLDYEPRPVDRPVQ